MKKKYVYIGSAVIIIAAIIYLFVFRNSSEEIKFRTEKISRGDIVVLVRATGTVNPVKTVLVGSQVSGTIAHIYVDYNSVVKAGQVIAQIDPTFLEASVKEAEANLERVHSQVNEAKRNLIRLKKLYNKDLISQAEMDAAQTSYETSEAQLKQAQAALDRARVNLRYATIKAPIDGVVISRDVDVGQTVAASLQAPKLFVIANNLKHMQVEANVDEADIGNIQVGQEVTFTVDAHPGKEFKGTVSQIRLLPQTVQNVVTYTVIIDVYNPDLKLLPGMTATVSILIDEKDNVLKIPALALRFTPPLNKIENKGKSEQGRGEIESRRVNQKIWLIGDKGELKSVSVKTGLSDNRYVEVTDSSVKEGDEVVIGLETLSTSGIQAQQTNPFSPRPPMGPGSGGRRSGF